MPPADATLPREASEVGSVPLGSASVAGWGGGPGASVRVLRPPRPDAFPAALAHARTLGEAERGAIARGMGRGYGDAAQLEGGLVLDTTRLKRIELDAQTGRVTAEAGVTIGELLDQTVPAGWMVPVVPGTQHVSLGGAIASDIHGKNHRAAGTFGTYVEAVGLLSAGGEIRELSAADHDPVFAATVGGMGLTGVILWARVRLRPVSGPLLAVDADRVNGMDAALAALSAPGGSYRVAWIDLLGSPPGRGIVTRAEHIGDVSQVASDTNGAPRAAGEPTPRAAGEPTVRARAAVPPAWPGGLLSPATVRLFNELRYRSAPAMLRGHVESIGSHMFPLDTLDAWPRLYGPRGFVQYQLVVPYGAERTLEDVVEQLRRARVPCYLAVLKDFGEANPFPLSFPIAGWTLALDLPRAAPGLEGALDRLDELVAEAGGRVYLTKDSHVRPQTLAAMYPRLEEWRQARDSVDPDGLWRSDLAERTGLVAARPAAPEPRPASGAERPNRRGSLPTSGAPLPNRRGSLPTRVLLLGGTSEIGLAIVRRLAGENETRPYLVGRDRDRLAGALAELERSGCTEGEIEVLDADEVESHEQVIGRVFERAGGFDTVVLAVGVLGAQAGVEAAREEALEVMRTNFMGAGSLLVESLRRLREQGSGTLIVLSSVAAERPRASNAVYGAAKAGLDALAQGLADATAGSGVRVLVVRPGFVKTKMTAGLEAAPMATTPEAVAEATVDALKGSAHTIWVPGRLRLVFAVLRHVPRSVFRRLPL
jgi:decaprenylphospho-beta-D-ribofuranose 2-oxidase